jgi:hypothetical protein
MKTLEEILLTYDGSGKESKLKALNQLRLDAMELGMKKAANICISSEFKCYTWGDCSSAILAAETTLTHKDLPPAN